MQWEAGETPIVGRLAAAATDALVFGLNPTPDAILQAKRQADAVQRFAVPDLPRRIDWRDHRGADWLSPIRDQSECGACVAFAVIAALEARVRLLRDDAALAIGLSEADLFFCGAGRSCGTGWTFEAALARCRSPGVGPTSAFPYTPQDQDCRSVQPVVRTPHFDVASTRTFRKAAIAERGPVVAGMRVFEDFSFYRGGVYKHVAGDARGLHAVCVVGYDDDAQCWIARNSWGAGWGENGCFRIGYGECGLDGEFVFYDPEVEYEPGGF
ncbi:MAG TPA: C1 family peptidase [Caulobacteraceae bacterium]